MAGQRCRIVSDDDGHNYIIPAEKFWEWDLFVEGLNQATDTWYTPTWATRIDHFSSITFENWGRDE